MVRRALAGALACALGGCTLITDSFLSNDFSGDPFPIGVDTASGALMVGVRTDRPGDQRAVLDLLSPFTLVDPGNADAPSLSYVDLTLLGRAADGSLSQPRARFPQAQLIALHPCAIPDGADPRSLPPCKVGTPAAPQVFDAVIGADALAGDAVRLRLGEDQIFVLADVGGSDRGRTLSCEAVFNSPYRGGGTLVLAGTELPFGNRRITLDACLGQDVDPLPAGAKLRQHGADALFVASTSIGLSILSQTAYERYRMAVADDMLTPPPLPFDQLPAGSVFLPSGEVTGGRLASIDRLALVGPSISNALSPCRHIYAHHVLAEGVLAAISPEQSNQTCAELTGGDCPCKDGNTFCAVPAVLELDPPAGGTGFDILVVPDTDPTLQALRTELRPDQPEVDGILGTGVLRAAEIDADYPHDRLIARCRDRNCLARPQLTMDRDRCQINRCITGAAQPLGCPGT
ncbi:MAG: hypothetical protein E6J90_34465 [Deltaproteobacteria bacterium]|nr:MAG: hypothetical protein E6J90_34465 [Deltaproteobacteria bacterium]